MLKITYFVHGTTVDNERGVATGWLPGELSELGVKQSKELASVVANNTFDQVYCSDLKRAIDSAEYMFPKYRVVRDKRLREVNYGDLNGSSDDFKQNILSHIKEPFPNGESYMQIEARMRDFLFEAQQKHVNGHIAIVGHQAPQLALEVVANKKSWEQAIREDWRVAGKWQSGWEYFIKIRSD